ncbi:MAG: hypothetical protein WA673_04685 [Candidatus Acidiferrales bacterium]
MKLQKTINVTKTNFATHADYSESGTDLKFAAERKFAQRRGQSRRQDVERAAMHWAGTK